MAADAHMDDTHMAETHTNDAHDWATELIALLRARSEQVATAESLTGGGVCAALTAVSGASAVVAGAVVAYLPRVKSEVLQVSPELIATHGVVSAACAEAMARGAATRLRTQWAVATTGVAGPQESEGRPVGTVFVAVHGPNGRREQGTSHSALLLGGDRDGIRSATVTAALQLLTERVRRADPAVDG